MRWHPSTTSPVLDKLVTTRTNWVWMTASAAYSGGHIYPRMAACEAALESDYGNSQLARHDRNLFGMKQHKHPIFDTVSLPTKEFLDNQWEVLEANFVSYPTLADCFADRMATLIRLRDTYPHYEAALTAPDAETYVKEVSKSWSTDPQRAEHVIEIFHQYFPSPQPSQKS